MGPPQGGPQGVKNGRNFFFNFFHFFILILQFNMFSFRITSPINLKQKFSIISKPKKFYKNSLCTFIILEKFLNGRKNEFDSNWTSNPDRKNVKLKY